MASSTTIASPVVTEHVIGPDQYDANRVHFENFLGTITIRTGSTQKIEATVRGSHDHMEDLEVYMSGNDLFIARDVDFRDWSRRFFKSWSNDFPENMEHYPHAEVTVPAGMPIQMSGVAGRLDIADVDGPLDISGWWLDGTIGNVAEAAITVMGSGDLKVSHVSGRLELDILGSGKVTVKRAGSAEIENDGSGHVEIENVTHGLDYNSKGSGRATFGRVSGPVSISVMGSGDVDIAEGTADPLDVSILGSADVTFGGTAHNSHVSQLGSGRVHIANDHWTD